MGKKNVIGQTGKDAVVNRRVIGLLTMVFLCMLAGYAKWANADMSLESRVSCQRTIEEVYWKHTIWPEENSSPKPPLSEVMSEDELRKKVTGTLRMSKALEEVWHHPVTGSDLQAEVERMAETTRDGKVLGELWSALGNDPQLIAECLARQTLVERLIHDWYAFDERFHGRLKRQAMRGMESLGRIEDMKEIKGASYHEMELRKVRKTEDTAKDEKRGDTLELSEDEWQEAIGRLSEIFGEEKGQIPLRRVSALQEDAERFYVMGVLRKGSDRVKVAVVEWRKVGFDKWWSRVGERFTPEVADESFTYRLPEIAAAPLPYAAAPNTWSATAADQISSRNGHTAVWSGTQMLVWGGYGGITYGYQRTGVRYSPSTNSWQQMSLANAPSGRSGHSAVWTGTEMIIWGGNDSAGNLNTGGRYNLSTNTWTPTATTGAPSARRHHTAVWTGTYMIVWGGWNGSYLNTGGRYSPTTNTWTSTATTGAPSARRYHTAVWTGTYMIVWGGRNGTTYFNTGGRYSPSTNTWATTNTSGVPGARELHTAVWTGTYMIVWGGWNGTTYFNTGGRYNPSTNSWSSTSTTNAPSGRKVHTAVWATSTAQMIVWGGVDAINHLNTGGRYSPSTNSWISTATTGAPTARQLHTAVWANTEMIVWGGYGSSSYLNTGGRYNPSSNSWTPTPTNIAGAPAARYFHTAVWTGTQMIVWGGWNSTNNLGTGGRYTLATNTWSSTTTTNAPAVRRNHTAVWTGTYMIVWGGWNGATNYNTGGRYNPSTNAWSSTTTTNAPAVRMSHTAVWTGTEMIVWGGTGTTDFLNTGGRYNPSANSWTTTNTSGAPSARTEHTAVWTGTQMIVWGGLGGSDTTYFVFNSGGRYTPSTNTWTTTTTTNAPSARDHHTAVWTGTQMIVWGGDGDDELNTGGRYTPSTNTWTTTATTGAPTARRWHTAVWTGTYMIVWGGDGGFSIGQFYTGGRYNPSSNTWTTTANTGAPAARHLHTAVWTGTEMIVWGGYGSVGSLNTGGIYCP